MAMARRWDRFGDQPIEPRQPTVPTLEGPAAPRALAQAHDAWLVASDLLGGLSGLLAVLAITALFSPLLTYGVLAPLLHLWKPAAPTVSLLALLPVVWLLTSAWVLLSTLRR